jgi:GAF domain-containing protein/HAMP domain-containing protein
MNDNSVATNASFFERILQRTGGWYLLLAVFATQLVASLATMIAEHAIQINADFTQYELVFLFKFAAIALSGTNFVLLLIVHFAYAETRRGLQRWKENPSHNSEAHLLTWKQITSFAWRYSVMVFLAGILLSMLPIFIYQTIVTKANLDQIVYTILGLFAGLLATTSISLLLLDYLLAPARKALLPKKHEDQLKGDYGLKFSSKLQIITFNLMLTGILFVAPIGYHQMKRALETGDQAVLVVMQTQSIAVSVIVIAFGLALVALFSKSVSSPLEQMLETFAKIESGDLKQRAIVADADEVGKLAINFNRMISRLDNLQGNLENQIAMRTEQLRATSEVGRVASAILDPDELIEKVVNLITERLGYYYAAIFVISPDGYWAELRSATGEAGKELKKRGHRLAVGGKSMVGSAISLKEARIAHDVGLEAVRFDNPLLPDTHSEIALPLIVGGRVLGALDAQSTEENAFDAENTETLQGMANQVAIALENARLFRETQEALREIRTSQQVQLSQAWSEVLDAEGNLEVSVGEKGLSENGEVDALSVPLALRDQIIGEISLEGDADWTEDDQSWVEAVATQAALAIENARLLEESQQVALQERLVAEITGKIWSSTTIESILQTAITELGRTLSANEAIITLNTDEEQ